MKETLELKKGMDKELPAEAFLKLNPPHFNRTYGVLLSFLTEPEPITLKFETSITYIRTIPEQIRIFKVDRIGPVYINDFLPETVADQLAYETGKVFYPLFVEVGFDGAFKGIHNHQEIKQRWRGHKENIREYFTGIETEQYLQQTEEILNDGFALDMCFANDWFIGMFFSPIYKSYGRTRKLQCIRSFPLQRGAAPVVFAVMESIDSHVNHYGAIEIHHLGEHEKSVEDVVIDDSLSDDEIVESAGLEKVIYSSDIVLHATTKSIESMIAKWEWKGEEKREVELRVFRTDEDKDKPDGALEHTGNNLVFIDQTDRDNETRFAKLFRSIFKT